MSRNRVEMSGKLFRKLQTAALADDPDFPDDLHARWIKRKSEEDSTLMAEAKVGILPLGMLSLCASIEHFGEKYFCFAGLPLPDELPVGLEPIDPTPGLFACVVVEGDMPANASAARVRDLLEGQHKDVEGYIGHELEDIMPLFPKLSFFRLDDPSQIYATKVERVAGAYIAKGYPGYPLPLSSETIAALGSLFDSGPDTIPHHLPLQGLLSYNWPAFFLDLYRCLEQLYSAPKLAVLKNQVTHAGSLSDLALLLENILAWRPREEDSLALLLEKIPMEAREGLISAICEGEQTPEATAAKCATHIYRLRNSHVHFRPAMKASAIAPAQWDRIVRAMVRAVSEVYTEYGEAFLEVPAK